MIIVDDLANLTQVYRGEHADLARRTGARHGHNWCHLSSRPDDDPHFFHLHAFAALLGLRRTWFQGDHYDLTPTRRIAAVRHGAIEVTRMEMSMVLLYDRQGRERPPYGTPDKTARNA